MAGTALRCPRDSASLKSAWENGIQVDRCPACRGAWYDQGELALLEGTIADEDQRRGMIEYAQRESGLHCPSCGSEMHAFNYRAYNLELDACAKEHGFWLDAGESERVRQLMRERVRGLKRSANAEADWDRYKRQGVGVLDRLKNMFR
jgi:Zn-finger nucleic acid-binding protein